MVKPPGTTTQKVSPLLRGLVQVLVCLEREKETHKEKVTADGLKNHNEDLASTRPN